MAAILKRKFAVVKLWPGLKAAEDECIARLKLTARSLGLECLEVDPFACLVDPPHTRLTQSDIDFVLNLHFETPKGYDIFSFVALWNPLQFYHDWGYRKFTRHLLTHDDFLSCDSAWADDHIWRSLANDPMRDGPFFRLYHTLSEPLLDPTTGEGKLFYAGINWERAGKKPGRYQALLKLLDQCGALRIYGPREYLGVRVWEGYRNYSGPVPFDGVSIVRLIHEAGVSLVLSSEAHQQSELMSCRLFESLAAGAIIICNENALAKRWFGDTLLYIDTTLAAQETFAQVRSHLDWIKSEPAKAQQLAKSAQAIFLKRFTLDRCLESIYAGLAARKETLASLYRPRRPEERIHAFFLIPEFQSEVLEHHIDSYLAQQNVAMDSHLVMDRGDWDRFGSRVEARLLELAAPMAVDTLEYFERRPDGSVMRRRPLGRIISDLIDLALGGDYVCMIAPNEVLFSDHLGSLLRTLQEHEDAGAAWSDMLLLQTTEGKECADLSDAPQPRRGWCDNKPIGFGRFLFRVSAFRPNLRTVLPYLDLLVMHLLAGCGQLVPTRRCTLIHDGQNPFQKQCFEARANEERELLIDYAPALFENDSYSTGRAEHIEAHALLLNRMEPAEKERLAVELAHSIPLPAILAKLGFGLYRLWLRSMKSLSRARS
jgi:hypothetical protein